MLPLVDKPLIQYVVEEAVASGIESVIIVTGRGKASIEDHFDVSFELEKLLEERGKTEELQAMRAISEMARVSYVRQQEALGLGHAVLQARDLVGDEPFAVMLSDDIIDAEIPALRQLLDVYEKYDAPVVAVFEVAGEAISRFGVIDGEQVEEGVYKIFEGIKIELHISNIHARDELHRHSITSSACTSVICGLGPYGYLAAMIAVVQRLGQLPATIPPALHGLRI